MITKALPFFLLLLFSAVLTAKPAKNISKKNSTNEETKGGGNSSFNSPVQIKKIDWVLLTYLQEAVGDINSDIFRLEELYFDDNKIIGRFSIENSNFFRQEPFEIEESINQKVYISIARLKLKMASLSENQFYFEFFYKYKKSEFLQVFNSKLIGRKGNKITENFNTMAEFKNGNLKIHKDNFPKFGGGRGEGSVLTLKDWNCYQLTELLTRSLRRYHPYFQIKSVEFDFKEEMYLFFIDINPDHPRMAEYGLKGKATLRKATHNVKKGFLAQLIFSINNFAVLYIPKIKQDKKAVNMIFYVKGEDEPFAEFKEGNIELRN